jgi:hypothetical protein
MDTSVIPRGDYCWEFDGISEHGELIMYVCPYYNEGDPPECSYLKTTEEDDLDNLRNMDKVCDENLEVDDEEEEEIYHA